MWAKITGLVSGVPPLVQRIVFYALLVVGIFIFGYVKGYDSREKSDSKVQAKEQATHTTQVQQAKDTKQSEEEQLTTFIHSQPIVLNTVVNRVCKPIVQAPAKASTGSRPAAPVGQQVPAGDSSVQPVGDRNISDLLNAYGALFDHEAGLLREQQSVKE